MKIFKRNSIKILSTVPKIIFILLLSFVWTTPTFAHSSPIGCTGSGLGINLFSSLTQAHIGDVISYSAQVFNGTGSGPIVCDATNIQASIVTPDGVNHPIALTRTSLTNGQSDTYLNVVTYTAQAVHINPINGTLAATASDTGVIHQNVTDSAGGANQGLNVFVLNTLHVVKLVVNDSGGTAVAADFSVHVKNAGVDVVGSPLAGTGIPGTLYELIAGTYAVSEDANASYAQSFSGDCDASGNVSLLAADNKTCTITNNDIPPAAATINVVKTVINDNGGTKVVADFPLFVNGTLVISGATNIFPSSVTYAVTETSDVNYTQTFSGDCDITGHVTLVAGANMFCIITNNDIAPVVVPPPPPPSGGGGGGFTPPVPPLIDVVKVPNPLALPNGPGPVTYTYTLRNIGTVSVNTITMVGDTCSPIILASGDNGDSRLDLNETWVYTCTTTLSATHTNTVVATGWANGISAVDIATATVVVGIPVVPPLIHVTKVPSPLALGIGGGVVTYTERVTNPGTVALSNVQLVDDRCAPLNRISGDADSDSMLDTSETWTYTCTTNLTNTTTNTAIASGFANGLTVRDFAIATVVVPVPGLPATGIDSGSKTSVLWNIIIPTGIFAALLAFYLARKKLTI